MHRSPLAAELDPLGARWQDCGDWQVVADFTNREAEYTAATAALAMRDASHLGRVEVRGKDHVDLLHRLTTNEMRNLQPEEGLVNIFTNEKGRIVERVLMLKFPNHLLLVTSTGNNQKVVSWIDRFTFIEDVTVRDRTFETAALQLIGPEAPEWIERQVEAPVQPLQPWHFIEARINKEAVLVVRLNDVWLPSFLLIAENDILRNIWRALLADQSQPLGESVYDVLRVESGWGVYGRELSESTNPLEAGQMPFVSFTKGCYIGQEVVARLDTYDKVQRVLIGFEFESPVPEGSTVFLEGDEIGRVTSVVRSPGLGKVIGLGYVRRKMAEAGRMVRVRADGREITARLVELPFVPAG
jgi:folate-binding protein YgfZ